MPDEWKQGEVSGLCARGGFVIGIKWNDNKLVQAQVFSKTGGKCVIKYHDQQLSLETVAGKTYSITAAQLNASQASSH